MELATPIMCILTYIFMLHTLYTWNSYTLVSTSLAFQYCFALIGAHQHGITMHGYHLSHSIMGRGGEGENSTVAIVYSIRKGRNTAW